MAERKGSRFSDSLFVLAVLVSALNSSCQSDSKFEGNESVLNDPKRRNILYTPLSPIDQKLQDANIACNNNEIAKAKKILNSLGKIELSANQRFYINNLHNRIQSAEELAEYDRKLHPTVKLAERKYDAGRYSEAKHLLNSVEIKELSDADKHRRNNLLVMIENYVK